nr:MAG TPA: trcl Probable zinc-ribbon domain [Caudoviricetes sp.]
MKLPKRCKDCRRKNREHPNPYHGIRSTMYQYPSTKGHRQKVHGGAL